MPLDRIIILSSACLLMSIMVGGEDSRKLRSINGYAYQPGLNLIRVDERDYNRERQSIEPNYVPRSGVPIGNPVVITSPLMKEKSGDMQQDEEKLFQAIISKGYDASSSSDLDQFDRIGERIIARANITEEAKRVVRQVKRERPGFFWTLFRVAFETVNETRSAIQQISNTIQAGFVSETTTVRGGPKSALTMNTITSERASSTGKSNSSEPMMTTTTTEGPYKLTSEGLQGIIRRNFRGLIKLFNLEWQDALNQSQKNYQEFQRDLGTRISPFLQDNLDVV